MFLEFMDILGKTMAELLALHHPIDHLIDQELTSKIPFWRIYNLSEVKLQILLA